MDQALAFQPTKRRIDGSARKTRSFHHAKTVGVPSSDGLEDDGGSVGELGFRFHGGDYTYVEFYLTSRYVDSYIGAAGFRMLELRHVSKRFKGIVAVDDVSFTARAGEITGYLGPNGSGKSTTMKMITGLLETTSGKVLFNGETIERDLERYKQRFGYVPEEPQLYSHLSGLEYLTMVAQLRNLPQRPAVACIDGLLRLFSLHGNRHAAIAGYSKGMRQKILLSAALLHNPDLLLLDEPFSGLDVGTGLILRDLIQELAARGKAVIFSSHELETVERVCTHVVILSRGKVVADDSIERLRALMSAPTLEAVFSQLAIEQDTATIARDIADLIQA
jgi:ABC-2 type transport system ATP-binding protein